MQLPEYFLDWLKSNDANPVLLVDINCHTGTELKTFNISTKMYETRPTDSVPDIPYIGCIKQMPDWYARRDVSASVADLEIINDGRFNAWFDYAWAGQNITLKYGDLSWSFDQFVTIKTGKIKERTSTHENNIVFSIKDKASIFDTSVATEVVNGKLGIIALGLVFNATPQLIDPVARKYRLSDHGNPSSNGCFPAVRDNGVDVLYSDPNDGTFTLNDPAKGEITCNYDDGNHTISQIVEWLCQRRGLAPSEYDSSFPNTSDVQHLITTDESYNESIERLIKPLRGKHRFNREGKLVLSRKEAPSDSQPEIVIKGGKIKQGGVTFQSSDSPVKSVKLAYAINNTIQNSATLNGGLGGSLSEAERDLYSSKYKLAEGVNNLPTDKWPDAEDGKIIETPLINEVDAQTEADAQAILHNEERKYFNVEGFSEPYALAIDDEVQVFSDSYTLQNGPIARVVEIDEIVDGQVRFQIWL